MYLATNGLKHLLLLSFIRSNVPSLEGLSCGNNAVEMGSTNPQRSVEIS